MNDRHDHRMYLNDVMARVEQRLNLQLAPEKTATHGSCPSCSRRYQLKADGTLRKHWSRDGMGRGLPFSEPCAGSGTRPTEDPQ
ncbi:hypothetical protein [Kitasatospora sp. A2-31]|uniref:hypothetical protein n=1 Tax=Kitasatospora sp. A2-31 TaxID=2916414 RepID=UPI001EE93DAE|nr:hypothetical protein [Kitasatospora sp. A2-31]MCG6493407.1 hypothetical protein [Kitasatospora sp. A2-31]